MKPGDVCKCISNFNGEHSGELILQKNDIVQLHKVIDKLWLEGEGGGSIGRFPSSVVVKTEIPAHPPNTSLYVAVADFDPIQDGDLPLMRGSFVICSSIVDEGWGNGESYGRKGIFPLNYVWKINEDLLNDSENAERPVRMRCKVRTSIRAQLSEELDLYAGDIVNITHILGDGWYRGECHGKTGIFPGSFVEIIESDAYNENTPESDFIEDASVNIPDSDFPPPSFTEPLTEIVPQTAPKVENTVLDPLQTGGGATKFDQSWKNVNMSEDEELFNDDYFRLNLPGVYIPSTSKSEHTIQPTQKNQLDLFNVNVNGVSSNLEQEESLLKIDSLSAKVEDYFTNELDKGSEAYINEDLVDLDFAYTEDNTGINPYGRAAFSFVGQYGNELSFKKGDIIHLIRHLDSHWTVGKLGIAKGIFPTSYIDIIVDCPYKAEDCFEKRADTTSKKAIVCFDYNSENPEDVSAKEGDVVLITQFAADNWVKVETVDGQSGLFPINHLSVLDDDGDNPLTKEIIDQSSVKMTKRSYGKEDFIQTKKENIDIALSKNLLSLDVTCKHSKPLLNLSKCKTDNSSDLIPIVEAPVTKTEKNIIESEVTREKDSSSTMTPNKPQNLPLDSPQIPQRTNVVSPGAKEKISFKTSFEKVPGGAHASDAKASANEIPSSGNLSRDTSLKSAEFPEDVSSSSLSQNSEALLSADSASSELNPQRPAPPRPMRQSDSENEEEFYSLPSETEAEPEPCQMESTEGVEEEEGKPVNAIERVGTKERNRRLTMRRESVKELMTTEHEYVHDLESLIQVVRIGKSRKEAAAIDFNVLMGNIDEVVELSKKFLKELNNVAFNDDEDLLVGPVFVSMADQMCEVYKKYSANNSISVGPLLQKYQEGETSKLFLNWILTELRQHKVNLLDMQAVLIKPVQRVLKYPLFIDNLVQNTPSSHADYKNLEDAKKRMLNVAKEINEYTKRLDLVNKYRQSSHQSFGEMIQRVSMRAVAKKGSRIRTRISATMGLINKTKDLRFEEEEAKFRSIAKASCALIEQGQKLLEATIGRHRAELGIIEAVASALLRESRNPQIEALRNTCRDVCNRILPVFEKIANKRVIDPVQCLLNMCSAPSHLIQKRYDKLLDFDKAQHKLDKNKDPSRTRILEEELKRFQGTYEALNQQLLFDLPVLNDHGIEVLTLAMRSLVSARMNLEGHVANLYLKLAQLPAFSYLSEEDYLKRFKSDYMNFLSSLKRLPFVTPEYTPKSPKVGRTRSSSFSRKKSLSRKERKASVEKVTGVESLTKRFDSHSVYTAPSGYSAEEPLELSLRQGAVVGVIKKKDPSGSSQRWFVDNGEQQGFVKRSCLQKYEMGAASSVEPPPVDKQDPVRSTGSAAPPSATTRVRNTPASSDESRRVTPHPRSNVVLQVDLPTREGIAPPPRYEDIFPEAPEPSPREDKSLVGIEENVYEEIAEVSGSRYCNIDEDPTYEALPTEGGDAAQGKEVYFPEPDEDQAQFYYALYHFGGDGSNQLSLHEGQVVLLLFAHGSEWWFVEDRSGKRGYVPASYLAKYT